MKQLITPGQFQVGEYYTNDEITYALEVGNSGGIRPKLNSSGSLEFVVVITSTEGNKKSNRNPYADRIEGNVLTYTGAGQKGDQSLTGVNKRLIEQVPVLGFVKEETNRYKFIGLLFLLRYYDDIQFDQQNLMRKVCVFEFQIISDIDILRIGKFGEVYSPIFSNLEQKILADDRKVEKEYSEQEQFVQADKMRDIENLKKQLLTIDPYKFETVMSELIVHVGFRDVEVTKKSGDGGIDINAILTSPIDTNLNYLFQVKRWTHSVGRPEVANLRGSMAINNQGVIITTSHFTKSAITEATSEQKTPINLIGVGALHSIIENSAFEIGKYIA